jgi:transcriptional regulator with XRE-family HTH domain
MKLRVGGKLLIIREERRLSQSEMAEMLEMSPSAYARLERNETSAEIEKLCEMAEKLNVPIQDLLPETVSINNNSTNTGNGGGMIFGNQYYYTHDLNELSKLSNLVLQLKEDIETLKKLAK